VPPHQIVPQTIAQLLVYLRDDGFLSGDLRKAVELGLEANVVQRICAAVSRLLRIELGELFGAVDRAS
jgi:hypothetical protein